MAHTGTRLHFYTLSRITSDCSFIFNDDVLLLLLYIYISQVVLYLFCFQFKSTVLSLVFNRKYSNTPVTTPCSCPLLFTPAPTPYSLLMHPLLYSCTHSFTPAPTPLLLPPVLYSCPLLQTPAPTPYSGAPLPTPAPYSLLIYSINSSISLSPPAQSE